MTASMCYRRLIHYCVEQANSLFPHRLLAGATLVIVVAVIYSSRAARAQNPEADQPADIVPDEDHDLLKPTEIGIRFTPQLALAMSKKFIEQMKPRYDLDSQQVDEITQVMQRQLMKFAGDNAVLGRDMIELMMATMIENAGRFPKDEAQHFARLARQFTPKFKEYVTQSSAEIGRKMGLKQRLKYTADVGVFAAGLVTFENRMKRWEEGKISDNANPFMDSADDDPAKAQPEQLDPTEATEHRQARQEVERYIDRTINPDKQWSDYVDRAAKYYDFSESQLIAARTIVKDCQRRAAAIRTPEWRSTLKEMDIVLRITYGAGEEVSQSPWCWSLNDAYQRMLKPMNDLAEELKRRIDDLPDSSQRANAREKIRKVLAEKGVKQLPA